MTERAVLPTEDGIGANGFQQQEKEMSKLDIHINALMGTRGQDSEDCYGLILFSIEYSKISLSPDRKVSKGCK